MPAPPSQKMRRRAQVENHQKRLKQSHLNHLHKQLYQTIFFKCKSTPVSGQEKIDEDSEYHKEDERELCITRPAISDSCVALGERN